MTKLVYSTCEKLLQNSKQMHTISFRGSKVAAYFSQATENESYVVLLHGFGEDSRIWEDWIRLLPPRHFVRIDNPGFGNSELHEDLSIESMAEAAMAVLDDLGVKKFHLAGHSMGGYISMAIAEKHCERLLSLCLFHSHPYADTEEKKAGRLKSIEFIEKYGLELYVRQMVSGLFAPEFSKQHPEEVEKLIRQAAEYDPKAVIAALNAMRIRPDRSLTLRNIPCRVSFIIGGKDAAIPRDFSLAQTCLPMATDVQTLSEVGHLGMIEAPRLTADRYTNFINDSESGY